MMPEKIIFAWSGGKDSTLALYEILQSQDYEVVSLLINVARDSNLVCHHGVKISLVREQAAVLGFPLEVVYVDDDGHYESTMRKVLESYKQKGIQTVGFGDLFLDDLRRDRERKLAEVGMKGIFPLWKRDTTKLAFRAIDLGFKTVITSIDSRFFNENTLGHEFNFTFLEHLPSGVDPCGERGEFHTFVYDGPLFSQPILWRIGKVYFRDGYGYADLIVENIKEV